MATATRNRKSTGGIVERHGKRGTSYAVRFRALGQRWQFTIGTEAEGFTRADAESELAYILAQVDRGEWEPPTPAFAPQVPTEEPAPTFAAFAREWIADARVEAADTTIANHEWAVEGHLIPFFGNRPLPAIRKTDVDAYRRQKIAEREATGEGLSNNSINKTIFRLAQILDRAIEYDHIEGNPARGKARRAKANAINKTWLDSADKIAALVDAAGNLNRKVAPGKDRALLATLVYAGLRISEALDLRWCDLDLPAGRIHVQGTKTDEARRTVNIVPVLRDELSAYAAAHRPTGATSIVRMFGTSGRKGRESASNVRTRVLAPAVELANVELEKMERSTIGHVTPHSLRRTFASILIAVGEDPIYTAGQLGHTDPKFTLRVYAQMMNDRSGERDRIAALIGHNRAQTPNVATMPTPDAAVNDPRNVTTRAA